jgi:hypothetical protein
MAYIDGSEFSSRGSVDSEATGRTQYTSRFREHMSQIYTAPPFEIDTPVAPTRGIKHKSTRSVDSTASTRSLDRLKRFTASFSLTPKGLTRKRSSDSFTVKGSLKTFRKEDIKVGGLTGSSNGLHMM